MHGPSPIDVILEAYRMGIFPMAESAGTGEFAFYKPHVRGLIPIVDLHIPRKILKLLRQEPFKVTMNRAFEQIIDGCAAETDKRSKTWINRPIRDIFGVLHDHGHAYSIECWTPDGKLAGGLYGLAIGAVFCGESMVSFERDASKIALVHLCALLWKAGFTMLDSQFLNPHLLQFGAYEMSQEEYEAMIKIEMDKDTNIEIVQQEGFPSILSDYLAMRGL